MQAKIFVGIPMYCQTGSPQNIASLLSSERHCGDRGIPRWADWIIQKLFKKQPAIIGDWQFMGDSLITRARNNLAHLFLKSDHTHLLFIDADLSFTPTLAERLLSHNLPLVCGWYLKKQLEASPVYNKHPDSAVDPKTGLLEVIHAGTGLMLIRRDVIEQMIAAYPETRYRRSPDEQHGGEYCHDLFPVGVKDEQYLSEDWYFCHRWREMGGKVYVDTKCGAKHLGLIEYPTPFQFKPINQEQAK